MGVVLADESDIKARLQLGESDSLNAAQTKAWPPLAEEATGIVEGFLRREWLDLATVPKEVRVVVSRMTVRAMSAPAGGSAGAPVEGQSSASSTFGPMSYSRGFGQDAVFTSPWLSKADRMALSPYANVSAVHNEPMYDTRRHDRMGYDFCEPGWSP